MQVTAAHAAAPFDIHRNFSATQHEVDFLAALGAPEADIVFELATGAMSSQLHMDKVLECLAKGFSSRLCYLATRENSCDANIEQVELGRLGDNLAALAALEWLDKRAEEGIYEDLVILLGRL